jgi:hypothetical protein
MVERMKKLGLEAPNTENLKIAPKKQKDLV